VRRAFASTSSAPAYSYDPYGVPLQATAPLTDFVYGGMFYNADSGLYLTLYRAYDPVAGRWLSRDPIGEPSDPLANLYAYVRGNPISTTDVSGLSGFTIPQLPRPSSTSCILAGDRKEDPPRERHSEAHAPAVTAKPGGPSAEAADASADSTPRVETPKWKWR
jgi:RHS repeat-associated protein